MYQLYMVSTYISMCGEYIYANLLIASWCIHAVWRALYVRCCGIERLKLSWQKGQVYSYSIGNLI